MGRRVSDDHLENTIASETDLVVCLHPCNIFKKNDHRENKNIDKLNAESDLVGSVQKTLTCTKKASRFHSISGQEYLISQC